MPADYKAQIDDRGRLRPSTIPQNEREHENLNDGDWVQVTIRKLHHPDDVIEDRALELAQTITKLVSSDTLEFLDQDIVTYLQGIRSFVSGGLMGLENYAQGTIEQKERYVCAAWANELESWVMVTKATEKESQDWVEEKKHLDNFVTKVPSGFLLQDDLLQEKEAFYNFMSENFDIVKPLGDQDVDVDSTEEEPKVEPDVNSD